MAAQTSLERILFGGMELTTPSDKAASGYSSFIQNFRVDKNNQLVSRQGSVKRCGPKGSGKFHTLYRTSVDVYAGVGTDLLHGPFLDDNVASGFDGEPLGIASAQSAQWIMNRAKRARVVGAQSYKWGVDAPGGAPSATGGGQLTNTFSEFQDSATVLLGVEPDKGSTEKKYAMQSGSPVKNDYAEADFSGDNSTLKVKLLTPLSVSLYEETGGSLVPAGEQKDDDIIRVRIYCSKPASLESLAIFVESGGGAGRVEFAIPNPSQFLNLGMDSWTEVRIRRRLNLDGFTDQITAATAAGNPKTVSDIEAQLSTALQTPTFVYTGAGWPQTAVGGVPPSNFPPSQAMLAMEWGAISKMGVSFKALESVSVGVGKVDVVGTVGENSIGAITYWYSYENIFLEDGNPSPASNPVVAGNQTIMLDGLAPSSDPNVTTKLIYRSGGGLSQPLLVARLGNAVTSWQDLTTNVQAQNDGVVMPTDRDLPPAARGVIGPIYGRLLAFNTDDHPSRYFWTAPGRGWAFFGADDDAVGDWEDAGQSDDGIVAATDHRPITILYKQRSIWKIVGDPATNDPQKTSAHIGIFGKNAVCDGGGLDYCVGPEGVYSFNGDFETKLSKDIDPIFKDDYVTLSDGTLLPPISQDHADATCIALIGDRLRVCYAENGFVRPNVVAIYHIDTGRWYRDSYTNLQNTAFSTMFNEGTGPGRGFIAGVDGGYLYQLETAGFYLDDNQTAKAIWKSPTYNQALPDNNKVYLDLEIDCQTLLGSSPNSPITVKVVFDGVTIVTAGVVSSGSTTKPRFTQVFRLMSQNGDAIGYTAKNYAVVIESDVKGAIIVYGIGMHWYGEERIARSFDSGPTNLGTEKVKQIDHAEFYMTAGGQAISRKFYSDLPGNILTRRESVAISAPAGRGTIRQRLDAIVEGRNLRLTLDESPSGATFQVHQARVRMRTIGEYLDGSKGEYFESGEFSIAPGRAAELKDFMLDYDVSGPGGRLEVYSDLPSNTMALRRTLALPDRVRAPYVFPLEDPTLEAPSDSITALPSGQLFKIRLYPPAGGILRLHGRAMFRARVLGVYFDGRVGEIWETQPLNLLDGVGLFRDVSIVAETAGPMTLEMSTELPGLTAPTMRVCNRLAVDTSLVGRVPVNGRLRGTTKGRLQQFRLVGPYVSRILSLKVLARRTEINDAPWDWVQVPLEATANAWTQISVPMGQTPEDFSWVEIPVDPIMA